MFPSFLSSASCIAFPCVQLLLWWHLRTSLWKWTQFSCCWCYPLLLVVNSNVIFLAFLTQYSLEQSVMTNPNPDPFFFEDRKYCMQQDNWVIKHVLSSYVANVSISMRGRQQCTSDKLTLASDWAELRSHYNNWINSSSSFIDMPKYTVGVTSCLTIVRQCLRLFM